MPQMTIDLDAATRQRLDDLARSQGQDAPALARRILLDYLDFQALPADSAEDWAAASVALAPEAMDPSDWNDSSHDAQ